MLAPRHSTWLVGLVALSSACSTGPDAGSLAARACKMALPAAIDTSSSTRDLAGYDASRDRLNQAAGLAAKASRADADWGVLATAYSNDVDLFDQGRLAIIKSYSNEETPDDQALLTQLSTRATGYEATIRAECRKALA